MKRTLAILLAPAISLLGAAASLPVLPGCRGASAFPDDLVVFVSGDSRGYLEPCGCRRDQAGGLPGRATIIEDRKAANRLVFDVGNLTAGSRPYELMKLRYPAEGVGEIRDDAGDL